MPKLDLSRIERTNRTGYPAPYDREVKGRWYRRLGPVSGLTEFGVSHVVLKPGAWSSQRHWHDGEDEFLVVLAGEAVLVEDEGRTILCAGDCAAFPRAPATAITCATKARRTACSWWSAQVLLRGAGTAT